MSEPTVPDATPPPDHTAAPAETEAELEAEAAEAMDDVGAVIAKEREVTTDTVSLGRRLRQPRTILSIAVPLVLLVLAAQLVLKVDFGKVVEGIAQANKLLLLAAFLVFYAGFPLRGYRWKKILEGTGVRIGVKDSTEILYLSWLVNCLVPAKLGDVYRAYLLKINSPVSLSRTFGTVFIERILDLFAIAILGLAAGFWSFRTGLPPEIQFVAALGVGTVIILAVALLTLRNFGRRIITALPLPQRVSELYDKFEEGVFGAVGGRQLPGPRRPHDPHLVHGGPPALARRPGPRVPGREPRHLGRVLRGPDRVAAHRGAAQPGRAGARGGGHGRRAGGGLRHPA